MRAILTLSAFLLGMPMVACSAPLPSDEGGVPVRRADTAMTALDGEQPVPRTVEEGPQVGATEVVTQLTGAGSANATGARWNVHGTDLGHMFRHKDELYMVFGDTYGPEGGDWRSNAIARIADPDPAGGLPFAAMIGGASGSAREVVRSAKVPGFEWTVIPTNGISVGNRMVLHYMSVRLWGANDRWFVRRSGLAYSDDDGRTWTRSRTAVWPAGTGFEQVAFVEHEGMIYVFGIPQGRFGSIKLGRVRPQDIFDPGAYSYWTGKEWSAGIAQAVAVVPAPAGELSVAWSAVHRSWLMMYLEPDRTAVVLRTAAALTGPWSDAQDVVTAAQYPGLYAPYIVPGTDIDGDVYFTMSRWKPLYNVFLMRTTLGPAPGAVATADPLAKGQPTSE